MATVTILKYYCCTALRYQFFQIKQQYTMAREMSLNIALTPISHYDLKTDQYVTYFEEFPQAIAIGETQEDADNRLIHLVEAMWKERRKELSESLLKNYVNDAHKINKSNIKIS